MDYKMIMDYEGGANKMSLNRAKEAYKKGERQCETPVGALLWK